MHIFPFLFVILAPFYFCLILYKQYTRYIGIFSVLAMVFCSCRSDVYQTSTNTSSRTRIIQRPSYISPLLNGLSPSQITYIRSRFLILLTINSTPSLTCVYLLFSIIQNSAKLLLSMCSLLKNSLNQVQMELIQLKV